MLAKLALAGLAAVVVARAAFAQDIEELKKRYKNMPGGDAIIAQLEAHRAEIEAANAKQKAQMSKLGLDKPAKDPKAILAMIPLPPKTVAEAKTRLGKVENGNGGKEPGDAKSAAAVHELFQAMVAQGHAQATAPAAEAGIVPDGQGPLVGKLTEEARSLAEESRAQGLEFTKASQAESDALSKSLDAINESGRKKLAAARCDIEGEGVRLTPAQLAKCRAIEAGYEAETNKARQAFLDKLGAMTAEFRSKVDGWLTRGGSIAGRAKGLTAPALQMPRSMVTSQTRNAELQALMQLEGADSSAVLRASEKTSKIF